MTTEPITSLKGTARITGVLMFVMAILAGFGMMYVPETLATAVDNIRASEGLLRAGIAANALVFLIEIILVALLYKLLKPVDKNLSLMAAFARLAMTVVQGVNVFNLFFVLLLVSGNNFSTAFGPAQFDGMILLFLQMFDAVSLIWGLFFGLHLVLSGYLVYQSGYLPKFIGILLLAISVAYFTQSVGTVLLPQYTEIFTTIGLLSIVEIVFPIWLMVKGVKAPG